MADNNITISVNAVNKSAQAFAQVKDELNRVKAELAKPLPIGPLTQDESQIRAALAGRQRGLQRQADSQRLNDAVNQRLGISPAGSEGGIGESIDRLKGISGRGSSLFELSHLLEGGGALIGAKLLAGGIAESANYALELSKQLAEGTIHATDLPLKLAEGIPIIGSLIKSTELFWQATDVAAFRAAKLKKELEQVADYTKQIGESQEKFKALVQPVLNRGATVGLPTRSAEVEQARQERDQTQEDLEKRKQELLLQRGKLFDGSYVKKGAGPLVDELDRQLDAIDKAQVDSQKIYRAKWKAAYDAESQRRKQAAEQLKDALVKIEYDTSAAIASTRETALRSSGRGFEARLDEIAQATEAKVKQIAADAEKLKAGQTPEVQKTIDEKSQADADAQRKLGQAQTDAAKQQDRQDQIDSEQSFQDRIIALQVATAEKQLRAQGKLQEADKLQRDEAMREQLEQIDKSYDEQIRLHAERKDELNRERGEEKGATIANAKADAEAAQLADAEKFRIKGPAAFTGESRLLTGVGSTVDPLLDPVAKTAKSTSDTAAAAARTAAAVEAMLAVLSQGGPTIAGPV